VPVVQTDMTPLTGMVTVRSGETHTCALDAAGTLFCWGSNFNGQLGDGTTTARSTAAKLAMGGNVVIGVLQLSTGGNHTCMRTSDGMAWCWGQNGQGELGDGTTQNQMAPTMIYPSPSIAAGLWHSCGVQADSTIKCNGQSWRSRLGTGESNDDPNQPAPVTVLKGRGGQPITGAIAGAARGGACGALEDHTPPVWGGSPD